MQVLFHTAHLCYYKKHILYFPQKLPAYALASDSKPLLEYHDFSDKLVIHLVLPVTLTELYTVRQIIN